MRSRIAIEHRGDHYVSDATGRFGEGHCGCPAGATPEAAALEAMRLMSKYVETNPEGGDLLAPAEVLALMPPPPKEPYVHYVTWQCRCGVHIATLDRALKGLIGALRRDQAAL